MMPATGAESWTVLGDEGALMIPVERCLAYLSALERSPSTVRTYAVSLRCGLSSRASNITGLAWMFLQVAESA